MAYKVIVSPRAQTEISEAIEYYRIHSNVAPFIFINSLEAAYRTLEGILFSEKDIKISEG